MVRQAIIVDIFPLGLIGLTGLSGKRSTVFPINNDHGNYEPPEGKSLGIGSVPG
jgi:hypothetical protein